MQRGVPSFDSRSSILSRWSGLTATERPLKSRIGSFVMSQWTIDAEVAQLAMDSHRVAQQQIARARGQDRRRKAAHVAVDRRDQRVLEVVPFGVERRRGVAEAFGRHQ